MRIYFIGYTKEQGVIIVNPDNDFETGLPINKTIVASEFEPDEPGLIPDITTKLGL